MSEDAAPGFARSSRARCASSPISRRSGSAPSRAATTCASLSDALEVSADDLYGGGDCSGDPDPECYDRNRATHTSGISIPEMPFQNRPTFQQAVAVKKDFH